MTLNLMLASSTGLYLTGDFRLTKLTSGKYHDDFNAQKIIPVFKFGWSALVSFTGIAKTPRGLDVGDWISEQVQQISMSAAFDELPTALLKANAWMIPGKWRLAISVVGFIRRQPVMMVISNYTDIYGHTFDVIRPQLELTKLKPKKPEIRVMGDYTAVHSDDKEHLRKLLVMTRSPVEIQNALAEINVIASQRSTTISRECVSGSLLATGAAEVTLHGISDSIEYMPAFVKRELLQQGRVGIKRKTDGDGKPLPFSWVGMTARLGERPKKDGAIGVIHVIRNAEEIAVDNPPKNSHMFWKIAGENEPERYTFEIQRSDKPSKNG